MKKAVDRIILSDLHLGLEVSRSKELKNALDSFCFKELVVVGDIFNNKPSRFLKRDWDFINYLRSLNTKIIWVKGNHDWWVSPALLRKIGLTNVTIRRKSYFWFFQGQKWVAIHGHQFDRFLIENPFLSYLFTWIYYFIQRIDTGNYAISRFIKKYSKSWLRMAETVKKGAIKFAQRKKCQHIICGHTHLSDHKIEVGVNYYNCGCWTDIPSVLITQDEKKGTRIHSYN